MKPRCQHLNHVVLLPAQKLEEIAYWRAKFPRITRQIGTYLLWH